MTWQLYDQLIDATPTSITVTDFGIAPHWAWLRTSDGHVGIAAVYPGDGRPVLSESPIGHPLNDAASMLKSWNLAEAGVGLAAVNAWVNRDTPHFTDAPDAFVAYASRYTGKRVGVVGHFPGLERTLRDVADLYVFERVQRPGDYPDSAFEYLAPDLDAVFITASALVNKTMPRLLELSSGMDTIIVGPSTPMTPILFDAGATTLSGFIPTNPTGLLGTLKGIGGGRKWDFGKRVNVSVDSSALLEWRNW